MPININYGVGQVNFTGYIHITVAPVSAPGTIVWQRWIDAPFTALNDTITGLDPAMYLVSYYDAPDNTSLGVLQLQQTVNGLSGLYDTEFRYYTVDGGAAADPVDGATVITDPYLLGKSMVGFEKRGFGKLKPVAEYTYTQFGDTVELLADVFNHDDTYVAELKYRTGTVGASGSPLQAGIVDVTAATYSISASDKNKRHRLVGSGSAQTLTLPPIATVTDGSVYILDNSVGGTALQPKVVASNTETINFGGFDVALTELWVNRGHVLKVYRNGSSWEVADGAAGLPLNVGQPFTSYLYDDVQGLPMDGATVYDGGDYPKLWWWLTNKLPAASKVSSTSVTNSNYAPSAADAGKWHHHPTLKKFRTPNWQGMTTKGVANFASPLTGDAAGRYEADAVKEHDHEIAFDGNFAAGSGPRRALGGQGTTTATVMPKTKGVRVGGSPKNLVDSMGVIWQVYW